VFSYDDLAADDWFVQEPQVTITRTQFLAALKQATIDEGARPTYCMMSGGYSYAAHNFMMSRLQYHLGLSET
jgi:hypothetical protein